jgi:hypothetical protein
MKKLMLLLGCACLLLTACDRHKRDSAQLTVNSQADISANTAAQQARLSASFYTNLVPKVKNCWAGVDGKGEVLFKLSYRLNGSNWEWQQAEVEKTDVSDKAKAAALDCMQGAARGSGFSANSNETLAAQKEYVVHWGFPVPFPQNSTELSAMMISTGGGGTNPECPKSCFDCQGTPGVPGTTKCVATCSGYQTCQEDGSGNGCRMTPVGGKCATGWSGFWGGEIFIARNRDLR